MSNDTLFISSRKFLLYDLYLILYQQFTSLEFWENDIPIAYLFQCITTCYVDM